MKLRSSSNNSLIDISFGQFNTIALIVEGLIKKISYSTNIEVLFRIDKIVIFEFTISIILRIS